MHDNLSGWPDLGALLVGSEVFDLLVESSVSFWESVDDKSDIHEIAALCKNFLYVSFFPFNVVYVLNELKSAQLIKNITTRLVHFFVFLKIE